MRWSAPEIERHRRAAALLTQTKDRVWQYLRAHPRVSEHEIEQFVQAEFKKNDLVAHKPFRTQIVAFNSHTSVVHYFPPRRASARLRPGTLILLDIWGRLRKPRAPYADITWMAYYGEKVPREVQKVFRIILKARDACLVHLRHELARGKMPTGAEMDNVARTIITNAGYGKNFLHNTGHCIGFTSPHGKGVNLSRKFHRPLERHVGYTIEPGIYLEGGFDKLTASKFGVRSEINFYITRRNKVVVTTPLQKKIAQI
jgi:Xaa-Pro aminopeptidase